MARFIVMILDGVGAGALPDAASYGDAGSNTLGNLAKLVPLRVPNLAALGLGNALPLTGVAPAAAPRALPGVLAEKSAGKDTTAGHWEHMGVVTTSPFPTYPFGFPEEVLGPFEKAIGRKTLGNVAASGTEIIAELGGLHVASGSPIVYTSADSVFQIAAHVDVIPLEELYRYCQIARDLLTGPHAVGRVIARPFAGPAGAYVRTKDRKDFSLEPPSDTYLDLLTAAGVPVTGVGKIHQIFAGRGVGRQIKVGSNDENMERLFELLDDGDDGLIFTNLVDFDMVWGHRNDIEGFAEGLAAVDRRLPALLEKLRPSDRLLITADHGVDPTTVSTDHSREYVPLLYYPRPAGAPASAYIGSMSDTGASAYFHLIGGDPVLGGIPVQRLRPEYGWRAYPSIPVARRGGGKCVRSAPQPSGAGGEVPVSAAHWLEQRYGAPPDVAIVLGSGLDAVADNMLELDETPYSDIPGWSVGSVPGHSGRLAVGRLEGCRVAILRGRVHGYEGFDIGMVQLPVRTLGCWGVRNIVITNASGGLGASPAPGQVAVTERILDFQLPLADGEPEELEATDPRVLELLKGAPPQSLPVVTYAALPGPQYETGLEVAVLRRLGADAVGMSTAQEVRAAREAGMTVTVLTVVTNAAGETGADGEAVHREVVESSTGAATKVAAVVALLLAGCAREEAG
ncbi:MAG TPA: phosphopentomutase [Thermoleophilia bacterium]|nr:phosphopentomutase [Thermoleophilia bacterium]